MQDRNITPHAEMMIKVCGMSNEENIRDVSVLYPMLMGFIFWKGSKRYAGNVPEETLLSLPNFITKVGVFVNEEYDLLCATCKKYGIDTIQLHGDESVEYCKTLKSQGFYIFKAIGIEGTHDFNNLERYEGIIDLFVFDTKTAKYGGSGRKFDHKLLENYSLKTPYLLSGGISPADAHKIAQNIYPNMVGIDLNSRFELSPGIKDIKLLSKFILELRKYNEYEPDRIPFFKKSK